MIERINSGPPREIYNTIYYTFHFGGNKNAMERSLHYLVMKQQKSDPYYEGSYHLRRSIRYGIKNLKVIVIRTGHGDKSYDDTYYYTFYAQLCSLTFKRLPF